MSGRTAPSVVTNNEINNNTTTPNATRLTRRLNVCISGTLANFFAEGAGAATWKPIDGKQVYMFSNNADRSDMTSAVNSLKNAYILNCKVLEVKSSLPVPVGVSINCIPNNELTDTAEKYAFTALPMTYNNTPHTLFEAETSSLENQEWRQQYREYTAENLATHNVLPVNGMPYVFVHENHPVISLLRANSDLTGVKVDEAAKIDGEWFKVGKQALDACCKTLQSKILTKINCQDLNQLQVQLVRLDAQEWTDHGDVLSEYMDADEQSIFDRPCSFHARLELAYELPN
jgi:hypothetical protein